MISNNLYKGKLDTNWSYLVAWKPHKPKIKRYMIYTLNELLKSQLNITDRPSYGFVEQNNLENLIWIAELYTRFTSNV